ncbi:hypothetical protein [Polaribacter sp.]|uniref:hypothetical protein n=1 Tax=Polaribacter sp. TaxID=1920175 RepID=UPI0025E52F9B|nr:hypothetical protein [Polaribacter sp.]
MNGSLKYTTAQKITLKKCFYALLALLGFTFVMLCLIWYAVTGDDITIYNSTPFFHPFKILCAFSFVLFLCGFGFGGIIDIYKKNQTTILIKHFNLKYLIQFLILVFALALFFYSETLIPQLEISQQETEEGWFLNTLEIVLTITLTFCFIGVIFTVYMYIKDLINNRKDYIKIDEDKIEFFNSMCFTNENSSNEIDEFNSIKNENVKKVELQFEIGKSLKSLESIKFILKNKKEVVMDLEEMSLSSYDNVIQNEIKSRFKGVIIETSNLDKKK